MAIPAKEQKKKKNRKEEIFKYKKAAWLVG